MKKLLAFLFCALSQGWAFVPTSFRAEETANKILCPPPSPLISPRLGVTTSLSVSAKQQSDIVPQNGNRITAGLLSASLLLTPMAAVASTEVELADLPPPYIPVAFGLILIVGVGVLTGSLGDVIDEESQLGMQSGARARKEIERSKTSYFKKK